MLHGPLRTRATGPLDPAETASADELASLQFDRLRWSLRHAYDHVAPYRAKCVAFDVHPDDLTEPGALRRFPFTEKSDLREAYPYGLFATPLDRLARLHASSGTTGRPTVVGYTARDLERWAGLVARSIRAAGGRPGDRVHVAYGYGLFTGGLGAHYGVEKLGCTVIPMSGGQTAKQVQMIRELGPSILMATPSYALTIADEFERQGHDPRDTSLELGIFGAEPWTEAMRSELEERFGIHALDIYGLSEVMGPGVASETIETKDGPVLWEDHFFPEIIDPVTGAALPDGEPGELVLTTLSKEALPMIRYRTRDLTRLLPPTARPMRRMGKMLGRSDDMLIVRGVNLFPTQIEELIMAESSLAPHFRIDVSRPGHLDEVLVQVELRDHGDAAGSAACGRLQARIKEMIGISAEVLAAAPGSLGRSSGKAQRVFDTRSRS